MHVPARTAGGAAALALRALPRGLLKNYAKRIKKADASARTAEKTETTARTGIYPPRRSLDHGAQVGDRGQGKIMGASILAYIVGSWSRDCFCRMSIWLPRPAARMQTERGSGEIGHRVGRKALGEVATAALADTILAWSCRV